MKQQAWGTVLALAIGAGLGVAITLFNATRSTEAQPVAERAEAPRAKDAQGEHSGEGRLDALERQLAGLRLAVSQQRADNQARGRDDAPEAAGDESGGGESGGGLRSPEEARKQQALWVEGHEHNLASHRSQERDAKWAPGMESSIAESLEGLSADVKAKIDGVECRTASCAVTVIWNSEAEAKSELEVVSRAVGQLPCSTEIGLPLDPPTDGPFEVELYMGCERRAL
jgi:hypothetical protein